MRERDRLIPTRLALRRCGMTGRRFNKFQQLTGIRPAKTNGRLGFYNMDDVPNKELSPLAISVLKHIAESREFYSICDGANAKQAQAFEVTADLITDALCLDDNDAEKALNELADAAWMTRAKDRRGVPSYRITQTHLTFCPHTAPK